MLHVYNCHLTLTPVAERDHLFFRIKYVASGIEPRSPAREANALPLRHRGGSPQYGCNTANTAKTLMNQLIYPSYEVLDQL